MRPVVHSRFAGLVLAVLAATAGTPAQVPPTLGVDAAGKLDPFLSDVIHGADHEIEVIVHFGDPGFSVKAAEESPEELLQSVVDFMEPVAERLDGIEGVHSLRNFSLQPAVALRTSREGLAVLLELPEVRSVELDDRWPLHTAEGIVLIGADVLHLYGFTGSDSAIAVIDTGIDSFHPSMGGAGIPNPKVVRGLDTADGDDDPSDCSGHGTAVASIAAGASFQWSPDRTFAGGAAPSAAIMAYKAAPDADCSHLKESAVVAAIEDAILHRETNSYTLAAINISGGGGSWSDPCDNDQPAMAEAVRTATSNGIAVVVSSGNGGSTEGITSPACLEDTLSVGSVWDQKASAHGSLFCLDEGCTAICSDQSKRRSEPTCYTNNAPILDLLAPSEYLRVAEAGGQITTFGGTSGAAPYVSGVVALLRRAYPDLHPAHLRFLLAATGTFRSHGSDNGLTPIVNALNALSARTLTFGDVLREPAPSRDDPPLVSRADVADLGPVGEVRLWIRLDNPSGEAVDISLTSPSGTSVAIWRDGGQKSGGSGLFGCFPVDFEPAESLNAFIGEERGGPWQLRLEPVGGGQRVSLESWALEIRDLQPPSTDAATGLMSLPIAARGPGANNTYWTTDLRIVNGSTLEPADLDLYFIEEGRDGSVDFTNRPMFLPPGGSLALEDIVGEVFDFEAAAGQILISGPAQPPLIAGRIRTPADIGGSFGQYVDDQEPHGGRSSVLLHLSQSADFRTNVGLSETAGSTSSASIELFDAHTGDALGNPVDIEIPPLSIHRVDRILDAADGPRTADFYALVTADPGVVSWASVIDSHTGDAVLIPGVAPVSASQLIFPIVARTPGSRGTVWRTDISVMSFTEDPTAVRLEFRPIDEDRESQILTTLLTLSPATSARFDDVVESTFGLESAAGSLRILPEEGTPLLAAVARTYNSTPTGSYGQMIPALSNGVADQGTVIHVDGSKHFRTNLFVTEMSGEDIAVVVTLRDRNGAFLGQPALMRIQALRAGRITDVFGFFDVAPQVNCRLDLMLIDGKGTFTALASVVDQTTGDAITVGMKPTP